jgi:hypothetical protein
MTTPPIQKSPVRSATSSVASASKPKTVLLRLQPDESLHDVIAGYLRTSGYDVVDCSSAKQAFKRFQHAHGTIDLLITGVPGPVSHEVELGIQLWTCSSNLKLIFLSTGPLSAWSVFNTSPYSEFPKDSTRILQPPFSVFGTFDNGERIDRTARKDSYASGIRWRCIE